MNTPRDNEWTGLIVHLPLSEVLRFLQDRADVRAIDAPTPEQVERQNTETERERR